MAHRITTTEAKRTFARLLREVQGGQSYVVTSHGRPVASIVPCGTADTDRRAALEALLQRLDSQPAIDIGRWSRNALYERGPMCIARDTKVLVRARGVNGSDNK